MPSFMPSNDSEWIIWAILALVIVLIIVGVAARKRRHPAERPEKAAAPKGSNLELGRIREGLWGRIQSAFSSGSEAYAELEEILVTSDFGLETTEFLVQKIKAAGAKSPAEVNHTLRAAILEIFAAVEKPLAMPVKPTVIMVLGVNGVGKTTSIGKLAARFSNKGKKVLLAAGDTFRAAAIDQLTIWAERSGAEIVKGQPEGDPAAVCFDAIKAALARGTDIVLCDTAGRLHTKTNLMEELKKVRRVMAKAMPDAPHEVWLVLDATTGQNALVQARQFNDAVPLTGVIMTKLDGTAKGGMLVALAKDVGIPVRYIGVGEGVDDLRVFDSQAFVDAVLG